MIAVVCAGCALVYAWYRLLRLRGARCVCVCGWYAASVCAVSLCICLNVSVKYAYEYSYRIVRIADMWYAVWWIVSVEWYWVLSVCAGIWDIFVCRMCGYAVRRLTDSAGA